jgi:mRNA interferase RelE/StbE
MEVEFLARFHKDPEKIRQPEVKRSVVRAIERVERASSVIEIPNCKRLKSMAEAYRIRIRDYRIGIYKVGLKIQFARLVHRRDIYDVFP